METRIESLKNLIANQSLSIGNLEKKIFALRVEVSVAEQARWVVRRDLQKAQSESASTESKYEGIAKMTIQDRIDYLVSALPEMADKEFAQIALDELKRVQKFVDVIILENDESKAV